MNIIVCIKQVPDTTEVKINPETNTLVRDGVPSIINPYDENALEAALKIKEQNNAKITVITMGPPQAKAALQKAIAMGADEAMLVSDRAFAGADTLATSYTLAKAIEKIGEYDLILCGKQAIDGDTAQVGPGIAEQLDIPQVTFASAIKVEDGKLEIHRMLEESTEVIRAKTPCVVTVVKQINEPRLPSLKGQMRAKKIEIATLSAEDIGADKDSLGLSGSPTQVVKIFVPQLKAEGEMLVGDYGEIAEKLVGKLKDQKVV